MSVTTAPESGHRVQGWRILHPTGWLSLATLLAALVAHLLVDTSYLIGHFEWWWWIVLVAGVAVSAWHDGLHRLRLVIEAIPTVTLKLAMILA